MQEPSSESYNLLASKRPPAHSASRRKPLLLTLALLGGLFGLAWLVFREQLLPATPVEAARVVLLETSTYGPSSASASAGMLFQASGWIEPDPWPVRVAVLTDGFIERVDVQEGDAVTNGQSVALLDATDHRLALEAARLDQHSLEAERAAHQASIEPLRAQLAAAAARRRKADARLREAEDNRRRIQALEAEDTTATERIAAERSVVERDADAAVADAETRELQARITSMEETTTRLTAEIASAGKQVEILQLALVRTHIRSPMDGRVLKRFVEPGAKRMAQMDDPNSATVVTLYDPARLQVRVDVPLAEAGRLEVGMPARVTTAMIGNRVFTGTVTRVVGEADLQRNTLQVKVAIKDPDPRMRPEVLCRVEFWGSGDAGGVKANSAAPDRRSLWVPRSALEDPSAETTQAWVIDTDTLRTNPVEVQLAQETRDEFRRVHEGLLANQWVVTQGQDDLTPGSRVRPVFTEETP